VVGTGISDLTSGLPMGYNVERVNKTRQKCGRTVQATVLFSVDHDLGLKADHSPRLGRWIVI